MSKDHTVVSVRDEPRHRHRFENMYVRAYDVLIPPGDRSLFHSHTEDTAYVALGDAAVSDRLLEPGKERTSLVDKGLCFCRAHREKPLTHQVENVGQTDMRMIGLEFLQGRTKPEEWSVNDDRFRFLWSHPFVTAYELVLAPGESTAEVDLHSYWMIVAVSDLCLGFLSESLPTMVLPSGSISWQGAGRLQLTNVGDSSCQLTLFAWK